MPHPSCGEGEELLNLSCEDSTSFKGEKRNGSIVGKRK